MLASIIILLAISTGHRSSGFFSFSALSHFLEIDYFCARFSLSLEMRFLLLVPHTNREAPMAIGAIPIGNAIRFG